MANKNGKITKKNSTELKWFNNVAKSLGYAASDLVTEIVPASSQFVKSNYESTTDLVTSMRQNKADGKRLSSQLGNLEQFKIGNTALKNALADIKSGKIYNKDRENEFFDSSLEDTSSDIFGSDFGDDDFSFGDDFGDDEDFESVDIDDSDDSVTNVKKVNVKNVNNNIERPLNILPLAKAMNAQTNAMVSTIHGSAQMQAAMNTEFMMMYSNNSSSMVGGLTSINDNLSLLVNFQNDSMSKYIGASLKYYEDHLSKVDESLETFKKGFTGQLSDTRRKTTGKDDDEIDVFLSEGGLDVREYVKKVRQNFKREFESNDFGSTAKMFWEDTETLKELAQNPLKFATQGMMRSAIPKSLEKALKQADESFTNFFPALLNRAANTKDSDNPLLQKFNDLFGVNPKIKRQVDLGNYNKGVIGFDGESKKALVEVIPTYLRKIESAISGSEEKLYDYSTGKFKTASKVQQDYDELIKNTKMSGFTSVKSEIKDIARSFNIGSEEELKQFYDELDNYFIKMTDRGKAISPTKRYKLKSGEEVDELTDNGLFVGMEDMRDVFEKIYKQLPKSLQNEMMGYGLNSSMGRLDKLNKEIEENSTRYGFSNLNNGFKVNELFTDAGEGKLKMKKGSPLSGSVDKYGLSQLDYLRDIKHILASGIVTYPTTGGGKRSKGKFTNPHAEMLRKMGTESLYNNSIKTNVTDSKPTNGNKDAMSVDGFMELNQLDDISFAEAIRKKKNEKAQERGFKSSSLYKFLNSNEKLHNARDTFGSLLDGPLKMIENIASVSEDLMYKALHGNDNEEFDLKTEIDEAKAKIFGDGSVKDGDTFAFKGILPDNVSKFFKENKFNLTVGGGLGLLGSFFLPGGPLMGTMLGIGAGLGTKSDRFQEWIFGPEFMDGKDWKNGFFGNALNKFGSKLNDWGIDPKYSAFLASGGAGLGLLSSFFLPFGPVGGALMGLAGGIGASTNRFQEWLFGEKDEDDKRRGGFLTKFTNWFDVNVKQSMMIKLSEMTMGVKDFFYKSIADPFADALGPLKQMFSNVADNTVDMFRAGWETITDKVSGIFEDSVSKPFGKALEEVVLDPLKSFMSKTFSTIGKITGAVISAPFKALGLWGDKADAKNAKRAEENEKNGRWDSDLLDLKERFKKKEVSIEDVRGVLSGKEGLSNRDRRDFERDLMPYRNLTEENRLKREAKRAEGKYKDKKNIAGLRLKQQKEREMGEDTDFKFINDEQVKQREKQIELNKLQAEIGKEGVEHLSSIDKAINLLGDENSEQVKLLRQMKDIIVNGSSNMFNLVTGKNKNSDNSLPRVDTAIKTPKVLSKAFEGALRPKIEGSHASGIDNVPKDGYVAELHEGEMVIPADQANMLRADAGAKKEKASKVKGPRNESNDFVNGIGFRNSKNSLLKMIARDTRTIAAEVKGQLDGVGSNVFKTRKILQNGFGVDDKDIAGSANKDRQGFFGKLRHMVYKPLDFAKNLIMTPINFVVDKVKAFGEMVGNIANGIKEAGKMLFKAGFEIVKFVGETTGKVISGLVDIGTIAGKMLLKGTGRIVKDLYAGSKFLIAGAFKGLGKGLSLLGDAAVGVAKSIGQVAVGFKDAVFDISKGLYTVTKDITKFMYNSAKLLTKGVIGATKFLFNGAKSILGGAVKGVGFTFGKLLGKHMPNFNSVKKVEIVGGKLDSIKNPISIKSPEVVDVRVTNIDSFSPQKTTESANNPMENNIVGKVAETIGIVNKENKKAEKDNARKEEVKKNKEHATRKTADFMKKQHEEEKIKKDNSKFQEVVATASVANAKTAVAQYSFWDKIFGKNGKVSGFLDTMKKMFSGLGGLLGKLGSMFGGGGLMSTVSRMLPNLLKFAIPAIGTYLVAKYEKDRVKSNLDNGADGIYSAFLGQGDERRLNGDGEYVYDADRLEGYGKLPFRRKSREVIGKAGVKGVAKAEEFARVSKGMVTNTMDKFKSSDIVSTKSFLGTEYSEVIPRKKTVMNTIGDGARSVKDKALSVATPVAKTVKDTAIDMTSKHAELIAKTSKTLNDVVTTLTSAIAKKFPKASGSLTKIASQSVEMFLKAAKTPGIMNKFASKLTQFFVEVGAGAVSMGAIDVVLGVWDVGTGFLDAANLFGVHKDQVDVVMRVISSAMKGLTKMSIIQIVDLVNSIVAEALGFNFLRKVATLIYDAIPLTDGDQLKLNQQALDAELEAYNAENGTKMSKEAYLDMVSPTTGDKLLGNKWAKNFNGTFSKNQAAKFMNTDRDKVTFTDRVAYGATHIAKNATNFIGLDGDLTEKRLGDFYKNSKSVFSKSGARNNLGVSEDAKVSLLDRAANMFITGTNSVANMFRDKDEKKSSRDAMNSYAEKRNTKAQSKLDKANATLEDENAGFIKKSFAKSSKKKQEKKLGLAQPKKKKKKSKRKSTREEIEANKKKASKGTSEEFIQAPSTGPDLDAMYATQLQRYQNGEISEAELNEFFEDYTPSESYYDAMINEGKTKNAGKGGESSSKKTTKAIATPKKAKDNTGDASKSVDKSIKDINNTIKKTTGEVSKSFSKGMKTTIKSLDKDMKKIDKDISKGFVGVGKELTKAFKKLIKEMDKITKKTTKDLDKDSKKEIKTFTTDSKKLVKKTDDIVKSITKKIEETVKSIKKIQVPIVETPKLDDRDKFVKDLSKGIGKEIQNVIKLGKGGKSTTPNVSKSAPPIPTNKSETVNNFTYYAQNDRKWGKKKLIGEETMADAGCGPTSLAMVMSQMTNRQITPDMIAQMAPSDLPGFSTPSLFSTIASKFNTDANSLGNMKSVKDELLRGRPVVLSGKGQGFNNPYTPEGHIVVATGIDGDNIVINDPRGKGLSKSYSIKDLEEGFNLAYSFNKPGYEKDIYLNQDVNPMGAIGDPVDLNMGKTGSNGKVRLFEKIIQYARAFKGKLKYSMDTGVRQWINKDKLGADCSSFTQHIYRTVAGKDIGANTGQQLTKGGQEISVGSAQPGDLILFKGTYNSSHPRGVSHVGIVSDTNGNMIDQGSSGAAPKERSYNSSYWKSKQLTAIRPLTNPNELVDPTVTNGNKAIGTVTATPSGIPNVNGASMSGDVSDSGEFTEAPQVNSMGAFDLMSNAFQNFSASVWNGKEVDMFATNNSTTDSTNTNGGTASINGRTVKALFSSYYPENSALQGGFYDAMGNKLDPSKNTCAAPKEVPFGTKIQIQGTNTEKDGQIYTVTDRGGAIKVRGDEYQFDLLSKDRTTAYAWGKRNGQAIIGDSAGNGMSVGKGPNYGYTGTYPGTINGFNYYSQADPAWDVKFDGTDMATAGCGPTSMAMVVSKLLGGGYTPKQILELGKEHVTRDGSKHSLFPAIAKKFNIGIASGINSTDAITSELKSGKPVILSGKNGSSNSPYTSGGHLVTAVGLDGNNIAINDPRSPNHSKIYTLSQVKSGLNTGWSFNSTDKTNSNGINPEGGSSNNTTTVTGPSSLGSDQVNSMGAFDLMSNAFQNFSASVWNGKEVDMFAANTGGTSDGSSSTTTVDGVPVELGDLSGAVLNRHLKNSLANTGDAFFKSGVDNKVNPALAVAISNHETGYGTSNAVKNHKNPGGLMDPKNNWKTLQKFSTIDAGVRATVENLGRRIHKDGLKDINSLGAKYAPIGAANDPKGLNKNWVPNVTKMYSDIVGSRDVKTTTEGVNFKSAGKGGGSNILPSMGKIVKKQINRGEKYVGKGGDTTKAYKPKVAKNVTDLSAISKDVNKLIKSDVVKAKSTNIHSCMEIMGAVLTELKNITANTGNTVEAVKNIEIVSSNASLTNITSNKNTNQHMGKQNYSGKLPEGKSTDSGYDIAKKIASFM